MNAARRAVVAVLAFAGVAVPATSAHADEPLLCGLLTQCAEAGGDDSGDHSEPAPTGDDTDVNVDVDLDVELVPDDATLLTPYAVAVLLRVSPSTVYRAIQRGQIRAERSPDTPRGKLRIAASEVQKWVEREREQERATGVAL